MEIQLQELMDQIKKDGVEAAEAEAAAILTAAREEAAAIVARASAEAEALMAKAKAENERVVRVGEESLRQAGRNVLLSFRESVTRELSAVVGERVSEVYSSEQAAALIAEVALAWSKASDTEDISILVGEADAAKLEGSLLAALRERMLEGVTIKPSARFDGGFGIAVNGGRAYYDYSAEALTKMLSAYLAPRVTALLKEAGRA